MSAPWTPEQVAYAGKQWLSGRSASEVARDLREAFGIFKTRNAVIGVLHRNGYGSEGRVAPSKPDTYRPARTPKLPRAHVRPPRPGPQTPIKLAKPPVPPKPSEVESLNARPWMERQPGECTFPLGERGAILSCCNPVERGGYCAPHAAVCFDTSWQPKTGGANTYAPSRIEMRAHWFTRFDGIEKAKPRKRPVRPETVWDEARAA